MEKLKHLSIKTAAVLTMIAGILLATGCSAITILWLDKESNDIYKKYEENGDRYYLTDEKGKQIGEGTIIYNAPLTYSKQDKQKLRILEVARTINVPIYFMTSMILAAFLFYRWKLQRPLLLLDGATDKISHQNLDFTIQYPVQDEMGKLVQSFEQMRKALYENNQILWRTSEERKRVNAVFAHDLRTPLTVLKGYNSFLQTNYKNPKLTEEKFQSTSALMEQQIIRLEGFVDSMSSIQKLEEIAPEPKRITSAHLIKRVEEIIQALETSREVTLQSQLTMKHVEMDCEIFMQVFENLFANALRYAKNEVTIQLFEDPEYVYVKVEDDGFGFSEKALQNATTPFYKEDGQSSNHFGLGLYISKVLCEKHGGSLQYENSQKGACITASFKSY